MFQGEHPELRRVLDRALALARDLGHPRVGSEHLLLALTTAGGAVAHVLASMAQQRQRFGRGRPCRAGRCRGSR